MTSEKEQQNISETESVENEVTETAEDAKKNKSKKASRKKLTAEQKQIQKLEEKISTLETELTVAIGDKIKAEDKMKRVVAEFDNMKKRQEREFERALTFARENLIRELLPLLDDLERSVQFENNSAEQVENDTNDSHQVGIRMIYERFLKYLQDAGVERFDPTGEPFDPESHDAMLTRPAENVESGVVLESFQPGYKMGERILRHAKVIVSQ